MRSRNAGGPSLELRSRSVPGQIRRCSSGFVRIAVYGLRTARGLFYSAYFTASRHDAAGLLMYAAYARINDVG